MPVVHDSFNNPPPMPIKFLHWRDAMEMASELCPLPPLLAEADPQTGRAAVELSPAKAEESRERFCAP